jgi:benzodiazapine receptor
MIKSIAFLIGSIVIAQLAGLISLNVTMDSISSWYFFLDKPSFSPPNWLFAPVWTLLYTLMGIAAYLIWRKKENPKRKETLEIYFLSLILNAWWSFIFFGLGSIGLAFVEIIALWLVIIWTIMRFRKINKTASWLLIPYLFWVSFAAILNFNLWMLN